MLFPAAIMTFVPLRSHFRFRPGIVCLIVFGYAAVLAVLGAVVASSFELATRHILPGCLFALAPLLLVCVGNPMKSVCCFLNAIMLCTFSTTYGTFIVAPWEVGNMEPVFLVQSGLACVLIACIVGLIFARTLIVKLPALFANESLDNLWKWIAIVLAAAIAFIIWVTPESPANVMIALLRPKSLAVLLLILVSPWLLYHFAWIGSSRIADTERLKRESDLLKMEEKRNEELLSYIDDARATRHDFRHHMAVLSELAHAGRADEVAAYADQFIEASREVQTRLFCENGAVDAIAAHYDAIAQSKNVTIAWVLNLPHDMPIKEVDFCSVLGNLVENAIAAAEKCDDDARNVAVKAEMFSENVIVLDVENNFAETLQVGEDGLPKASREGHGIGIASISAIARKYGGSLNMSTDKSTLHATVLLYAS